MKVFFDERQNVSENSGFSPSAGKPAKVLESWLTKGFPIELESPVPLSRSQISLAHSPKYVDGVLNLKLRNGFGNRSSKVAESLPWTTGAMVSSAKYSAATGKPSVALASGFHHACHSAALGFCTFNALVIAGRTLQSEGPCKRVGILDCDMHYGNGTTDIIHRLNLDGFKVWSFGEECISQDGSDDWLGRLPSIVQSFADCQLLIYQAGADPHIDDPLGGVLTTDQMRQRDLIVFRNCLAMGLPVSWTLAGGYQTPLQKVLDLHDITALACLDVYESWSPET